MNLEIVADNKNQWGDRICTFFIEASHLFRPPSNWWVHSSPVIPTFETIKDDVRHNPQLVEADAQYRNYHRKLVREYDNNNLTSDQFKQLSGPFQTYRWLLTSTQWDKVFEARSDLGEFKKEYNKHTPQPIDPEEYHTPFVTSDKKELRKIYKSCYDREAKDKELPRFSLVLSFTRCVYYVGGDPCKSISYLSKAHKPEHHFKKEHIARCMTEEQRQTYRKLEPSVIVDNSVKGWNKRYRGFLDITSLYRDNS